MNGEKKVAGSLAEIVLAWIQDKVGTKGVVVFFALGLLGTAAWNWETISVHPMVERVRERFFADPMPVVERGAISILIANLNGDVGHKFREELNSRLIPEQLPVGRSPIHIYKLDRYVRGSSSEVIQYVQEARANARELLRQTKADLLVWGSLVGTDKNPTPVIFVTASGSGYSKVSIGTDIKIPSAEKADMMKLLRVVALTEWAQLEKEDGTAFETGIVDQLKTTFSALKLFSAETGVAKHEVNAIVARAKARIGRAYDNQQLLREARESLLIVAAASGLDLATQTDVALGLGLANFGLADLMPANFTHMDALHHYQSALKLAESSGDTRRQAQALIGIAGSHLAQYQANLKAEEIPLAMDHAKKAQALIDRKQSAADWCRAAQTIAVAHRLLGEIKHDSALMQQSIDALQDVLEIRNKEVVPVFWANTKNSLGNVWSTKAALTGDDKDYDSAMNHYQGALEVFDATRFPLMHGTVTMNLALAEEDLWQRKHAESLKQRALAHFHSAKLIFQRLDSTDRMQKAVNGIARLELPSAFAVTEQGPILEAVAATNSPSEKLETASKALPDEKFEAAMRRDKLLLDKYESKGDRSRFDKAEMSRKSWMEFKVGRPMEKMEVPKK